MVPEIVDCLDRTVAFCKGQVADLTDKEMVFQPKGFPNHAAWTLGHIVCSCQLIAAELGVKLTLQDDWESHFGYGSTPDRAMSDRSSKEFLLKALDDAYQQLRTALLAIDDKTLLDPLPDEKSRAIFPTRGHALVQVVTAHTAFHAGQLAAWRRALGRQSVGTFI